MTDLDSLLRWPLDTNGWRHTLLVGTLLVATLPLAVPGVLLAGYAVRLLRTEPDDPALPTFADLRSLAGTGLRAAGIVVAYHLPAAALLAAGTTGVASAYHRWRTLLLLRPGSIVGAFDLTQLTGAVGVALLGMALLPVCGYVATVAVTAYADADDVAAAFALGRLRERVCTAATLRAWLLASLAVVVSGICAALLGGASAAVPAVGSLLTAAVRFYGGLVAVGVWNETRPADGATDGDTGTGAAKSAATADPARHGVS
jgi:hypothetical protein